MLVVCLPPFLLLQQILFCASQPFSHIVCWWSFHFAMFNIIWKKIPLKHLSSPCLHPFINNAYKKHFLAFLWNKLRNKIKIEIKKTQKKQNKTKKCWAFGTEDFRSLAACSFFYIFCVVCVCMCTRVCIGNHMINKYNLILFSNNKH